MAREEYQETKHLLRNALENASGRLTARASTLEIEAQLLRSDARRIGKLATLYGTLPPRRLLPTGHAPQLQSIAPTANEDDAA